MIVQRHFGILCRKFTNPNISEERDADYRTSDRIGPGKRGYRRSEMFQGLPKARSRKLPSPGIVTRLLNRNLEEFPGTPKGDPGGQSTGVFLLNADWPQ